MPDAPDLDGYVFLGWGPRATGSVMGWRQRSDLVIRCGECGSLLSLGSEVDESCRCRRLTRDVGAGRISCRDGDAAVAVYRER